jgi:hypothetical protein
MIRRTALVLAAVLTVASLFQVTSAASAEPATRYSGLAFDTCTAPSFAAMTAWGASPYRAVGIYFGGVNRACAQPQLTPGWVTGVTQLGWRLLPIYKGLQPPCGGKPTDQKVTASGAKAQGAAAASDAVRKAEALGLRPGSAFYNDIEHYSPTDVACRRAVLTYLSAWTKRLHRLGYLSGVYANLSSGARHLSDVYYSRTYARPDALWIARYDGDPSLTGWAGISDRKWAGHRRAKQYIANQRETYGGVRLNIDRDMLDAPVATVVIDHNAPRRQGPGRPVSPTSGRSPTTTP